MGCSGCAPSGGGVGTTMAGGNGIVFVTDKYMDYFSDSAVFWINRKGASLLLSDFRLKI
jgi:hypothetical protein